MKNKDTEELVEIFKNTPQLKAQLEEAYDEVRYIASEEKTINNKDFELEIDTGKDKIIIPFLNEQRNLPLSNWDMEYECNFTGIMDYKVEYEGIEFILVNIPMEDVLSNKMLTVIEDIIVNQDYKHYSERIDYLKYLEGVNDGDNN